MKVPLSKRRMSQLDRKTLRWRQWITKCKQHGLHCHYCKVPLLFESAVKEHLTPLCRGGIDHIDNIVPACSPCNQMKAWRTEEEFVRDYAMLLERRTVARAIDKPKPFRISPEEKNEPGLLKRLCRERDGQPSWAWRNPA
jgi:5-methylcytosine-specific restriction endonuclease McrA